MHRGEEQVRHDLIRAAPEGQIPVDLVIRGRLLQEGKDVREPGCLIAVTARHITRRVRVVPRREVLVPVVVHVQRQPDLLEVVRALGTARRLTRGLHGGQQQGDQNPMIAITRARTSVKPLKTISCLRCITKPHQ